MSKSLATDSLAWADLRRARIRHWLLEPYSDEFQTLSWEQAASSDGTSEGAVLWYDYEGKSDPGRAGTESYPAVEARVMPDGTTWYRDYARNTLGKPLAVRERWDDGAGYPSRVETFTYSADGVDLLIHTNALGIAELRLGYDASHRVIARTNALNEVERFGYDANGRMTGQTNAADWRLVRTFSTDGLSVTNVAYLGSSAYQTNTEVTYLNQSYTRTNLNAGNITQATRWVVSTDARGLVTTNIFDPLGRLWERRSTGGLQEQWHYELHPGESYATGSGGTRLLDVTAYVNALGQMRRMTYDGIRRLVQTVDTRGTTNQMAYCDCGSPATVVEAAGTAIARTASYEYDFQGKRWKTTTPEDSMSTNQSHVLIVQERNAGHTPQVTYTRGLDLSGTIEGAGGIGGLLMRSHGYSGGNWSTHNAYHSDANGNVTALMNSSGVLQASYKYNPYGGLISSSGPLAGANTMRFSSKPAILSATGAWGFYYYGYRFYDPGMQRWLNRDPLGEEGGVDLYCFTLNSPTRRVDSDGRASISIGPGAAEAAALEADAILAGVQASAAELAAAEAARQAALKLALAAGAAVSTSFCPKQPEDPCHKQRRLLQFLGEHHRGLTGKVADAIRNAENQQVGIDSIPGMSPAMRQLLAETYEAAADCNRPKGRDVRFNELRAKLLRGEVDSIPRKGSDIL